MQNEKKKTILVVEDEDDVMDYLTNFLEMGKVKKKYTILLFVDAWMKEMKMPGLFTTRSLFISAIICHMSRGCNI